MRKCFSVLILLVFILVASSAYAFDVCIWKDCPQSNVEIVSGTKTSKIVAGGVPELQIIPNINLNGETNYIFWRREEDGGTGFGFGAGTTIAIFWGLVDVDAKYIKMTDAESSDLVGAGFALDIIALAERLVSGQVVVPDAWSIKAGLQGLSDLTHEGHLCGGAYTKLQIVF